MSMEFDIDRAYEDAMQRFLDTVYRAQIKHGLKDHEVQEMIARRVGYDFSDAWYEYTDADMDEGPERQAAP